MNDIFDNVGKILIAVFGLVMLIVGLRIAASSKKAQYADTARTSANVVVSMIFVAIGVGAIAIPAFGTKLLSALGIS